ncbi:MAG: HU family DNA-binding protein [Treponema sp.]|nr:HU family DNA-binding protein [Treponema sp.]
MNEFLTPSGLAQRLVERTGISLEIAKNFSSVFFMLVRKGLKDSESFSVYNFGTFKKTWIEATVGLNPSTGEKINIPAHWRIKFIPCSAVAKRINRPYAHLKAKELPDDAPEVVEEDEEMYSAIPAPVVVPEEDSDEAEPEIAEAKTRYIEPDDDDEDEDTEDGKKRLFFLAVAGIGLLFLLLLVSFLIKSCTGKSKKSSASAKAKPAAEKPVEPLVSAEENTEVSEPVSDKAEIIEDDDSEGLRKASLLFESYTVPTGSDYHTIAGEKYGNRHLWPILYAANKSTKPDPDLIGAYNKIQIPELLDGEDGIKQIEDGVMDAYNGYLLMCEKQPDSERNDERRRLAIRVLVSGEILSPGFIDSHSKRILPEYAEMARSIVKNQYL